LRVARREEEEVDSLIRVVVATLLLVAGASAPTGCALLSPPLPPRGPAPRARLVSVEPRVVDGVLAIRYEIVNDGPEPIHLIDGLASPPPRQTDAPFDPLVTATPTHNGVVQVRKGDLPAPERRFFVVTNVPVLTTVGPGERFSEVFRLDAPAGGLREVALSLDIVSGVATREGMSADGRVLTAPWPELWAARWQLDAAPVALDLPPPLGGD
jgi:hypothetical protein